MTKGKVCHLSGRVPRSRACESLGGEEDVAPPGAPLYKVPGGTMRRGPRGTREGGHWWEVLATERGWSWGRGWRCWTCCPQVCSPTSTAHMATLQMSQMIGVETRVFILWWSSGEGDSVKSLAERDRVGGQGPCSRTTGPMWGQGHRQGGCVHGNPTLHLFGVSSSGQPSAYTVISQECLQMRKHRVLNPVEERVSKHSIAHVLKGYEEWRERAKTANSPFSYLMCANVRCIRGVNKNVKGMLREFFGRTSMPVVSRKCCRWWDRVIRGS